MVTDSYNHDTSIGGERPRLARWQIGTAGQGWEAAKCVADMSQVLRLGLSRAVRATGFGGDARPFGAALRNGRARPGRSLLDLSGSRARCARRCLSTTTASTTAPNSRQIRTLFLKRLHVEDGPRHPHPSHIFVLMPRFIEYSAVQGALWRLGEGRNLKRECIGKSSASGL